jgi:hypothetical protein
VSGDTNLTAWRHLLSMAFGGRDSPAGPPAARIRDPRTPMARTSRTRTTRPPLCRTEGAARRLTAPERKPGSGSWGLSLADSMSEATGHEPSALESARALLEGTCGRTNSSSSIFWKQVNSVLRVGRPRPISASCAGGRGVCGQPEAVRFVRNASSGLYSGSALATGQREALRRVAQPRLAVCRSGRPLLASALVIGTIARSVLSPSHACVPIGGAPAAAGRRMGSKSQLGFGRLRCNRGTGEQRRREVVR